MSITTRPNDDYAEYKSESYLDTDWLINDSYPQDMDIMCYEGSLVDNYIGYQPNYQSIVRVTLHSHYPLQTSELPRPSFYLEVMASWEEHIVSH